MHAAMIPQTTLLAALSLVGVLALIGLTAKLLAHRVGTARPRTGRALVLKETIAIDPRRRLHLVACGDRQVIVLTGGTHDLVVGWLPEK
jgi:flagellar protein FliO/FliZ